ncbi:MAG: gamma carbonic anhydrase family protein [Bacteriovoracaceae bacterium]|nr:gamma carbonic anhydrase family protein [Bacteriovoracaceae bacterium]
MAIYKYKNLIPSIGKNTFIADSVDIIGDVKIGDGVSVWFNSVLRGDVAPITIGDNTNVQDCSMIHVDRKLPTVIGSGVTIGHKVTLHGCNIGNNCLIGMDSVILDHVIIGENSLVAAGSIVTPGKKFPPRSFIMGSPAKLVRELSADEVDKYGNHFEVYSKLATTYIDGDLVKLD